MTAFLSRNATTGRLEEIVALSNSDAFGRQRVSAPETLFDLSHLYDKQPLYVEELLVTGGTTTHLPNEAAVRMDVTTTAASRVVRQTKRYFSYQPGKSMLVLLTGVLTDVTNTGITSRIGFFDDAADKSVDISGNGIFFEYSGGTLKIVKRSYTTGAQVDTAVAAASWSEGDPLDGTGPSGVTFDPTKAQIFWVDLEWLGVGSVRCGIVVDGAFITLHKFHHANLVSTVYMGRASLPIRYEITRVSGATAGSMKQICATVISEGGYVNTGRVFSRAMTATRNINMTEIPLMAIRLRAGYTRATLKALEVELMTTSNQSMIYNVRYGATLTGATWISHDAANSGVEYSITPIAFSGGRVISSGMLSSVGKTAIANNGDTFDAASCDISGSVPEIIVITAIAPILVATYGSITWRESY